MQLHADLAYLKIWLLCGCPCASADEIPTSIYDLHSLWLRGVPTVSPQQCAALLQDAAVITKLSRFQCVIEHVIGAGDGSSERRPSITTTSIVPEAMPSGTEPFSMKRLPDADSWMELLSFKDRAPYKRFVESERALKRQPQKIVLAV